MGITIASLVTELGVEADSDAANEFADAISSIKKGAVAAVGAVAALSAATVGLTKRVANNADEAAKTARTFDITTESVQRLQVASDRATKSGVAVERMLRRVRSSSEDAAEGGNSTADAFGRLNVNAQEILDMSPDEGLLEIADAFSEMEDRNRAMNEASEIFGRRMGEEVVPFLLEGRDGIEEMGDRADELGMILGSDFAEEAEHFNDELGFLFGSIQGVVNQMAAEMLPVLQDTVDAFLEWRVANEELIDEGIDIFVATMTFLFEGLTTIMMTLSDVTTSVTDAFGGLKETLRFIGILIGSLTLAWAALNTQVLFSAFTAIVAFTKAAVAAAKAWIVALAPVLLLGGALALVFLLVEDLFGFMDGESALMETVFGDSADAVLKAAGAVGALIVAVIGLIGLVIGWPVALAVALGILVALVIAQWDTISQATMDFLSFLWDGITGAFNSIVEWLADLGTSMWDGIRSGFQSLIDFIQDTFNAVIEGIEDRIDQVTGAIDGVVDGAKGAVNVLPGVDINSPNREEGLMAHVLGMPDEMPQYDVASMVGGGAASPAVDMQRQQRAQSNQSRPPSEVTVENTFNIEGDDPETIARKVEEKINQILRQTRDDLNGGSW